MARGQRKSESGDSSDSSSGSSSSSSSSDDTSGKSSRESSPDQKQRKKTSKSNRSRQSREGDKKSRNSRQLKEKSATKQRGGAKSSPRHKRVPRSPSPPRSGESPSPRKHERGKPRSPPGSPPSESGDLPEDTHMEKVSGGRSADELSIGAGASDDEYREELAQEDVENVSQEVPKKSKSRREGLSSGEVTPEDGDSDDSYSWRESRVRTMLQSHVQKPSNDGPRRESYDRYDSDHEGAQPFRSVVGTTITRPGQRYSDSDDGEIIDSDEEQEKRKSSRDKYSHGSPKRHSNQEDKRHRTTDSSTSHRNGDRDSVDKNRIETDREASRDRKRSRKRAKEGSTEKTEDKKERKEKRKERKDDEHYEDAKVKFRKRVWDKKEEESKGKRKAPDSPRPEEDDKPKEVDNKENEVPPPPKKKKEETLMTRTGGAYIPPAKLRMMQAQITDKSSEAYQRMSWEALKKSINGLINKVNVPNIPLIVQELLQLNIVRGRGLLARSIVAAQTASPTFTHVYGALVAIINTKFPQNGELLLRRLIINFKKGFRRNDKTLCLSSTRFIAHLVNQQVAHEIVALEILTLLLENVTDDSVEVAVGFVKECGLKLQEVSPRGIHAIFERMRSILHEAMIDKRVQYMVEVVFANRKDGFKDYPSVLPELDLVEESDQFTHMMTLEDTYEDEALLNVFKMDPEFLENEEKYKSIKKEILDEGSDDSDSDGGESGEASSSDDSDEEKEAEKMEILDKTETNLVALRRTIYLTIQSSLDFEECAHKMLKMDFKPGQEREVCNMILDCCAQQRTYEKFFGLLAQRFCQLKREYVTQCEAIFPEQYSTCHRLDTNKLRNVAKLFSHLLHTDAISWTVLDCVRMNEEDTTSSSRIFIKILFLELSEFMGLPKLNDRLKDKTLLPYFEGLLPRDNPANTRFAINFFTTIGLGGLTDDLRDHLKNVQRQIMQQRQPVMPSDSSSSSESESSSSSGSSESSSDSSSESSDSDRDRKKKKKKKVKETASKKSAPTKKDAGRGKEESRGKENGRGRNKEKARQEERPRQEERVDRRNRPEAENDMGGKGKRRGDSREMEDSRTQRNNRERDRTEMRGRPNDSRSNYANHDDERDPRHARNEDRDPRRSRNEDMDSRYVRNDERDPRHVRNEERDPKQVRNDERDPRHVRNEERDPRHVRNDERDPRHVRNDERDPRHVRNDERDPRKVRNEDRDPRQVINEDRDQRHTRNEDRTREKPRGDERSDRNGERQQNAKERQQNSRKLQQQNKKRSKQQEEEESDSSESESSSSEESSSSSSESESSMDASPPRETQDKRGRGNPNLEEGRGNARENFSDKENQRGNRQRTRTDSSSDGYQKFNEPPGRDMNRHNSQPNNEYKDHRQARGDGWDGRRNRDNQYDRGGGNVRNPRTRYNSRGEEDYVNNARNKDYRGQDRMDTDGFDRRNDRGRGGYENDKPPPRHNERDRYDGDRGSRYNRY